MNVRPSPQRPDEGLAPGAPQQHAAATLGRGLRGLDPVREFIDARRHLADRYFARLRQEVQEAPGPLWDWARDELEEAAAVVADPAGEPAIAELEVAYQLVRRRLLER